MIRPLHTYCLIKPDNPADTERKTKSGLYVPDTHLFKVNATQGTVLEVSPEVKKVKKGDYVIFNHRVRIILNDELGERIEQFFVKEEDVLGIIKAK